MQRSRSFLRGDLLKTGVGTTQIKSSHHREQAAWRCSLPLSPGDDTLEARPGTWVHMPAGLKHGIQARTPVVMLLMLLKGP